MGIDTEYMTWLSLKQQLENAKCDGERMTIAELLREQENYMLSKGYTFEEEE